MWQRPPLSTGALTCFHEINSALKGPAPCEAVCMFRIAVSSRVQRPGPHPGPDSGFKILRLFQTLFQPWHQTWP